MSDEGLSDTGILVLTRRGWSGKFRRLLPDPGFFPPIFVWIALGVTLLVKINVL